MTMADIVCDQFSVHLYCEDYEFCCEDNTRCCSLYFRDDWSNFYKFFTLLFVCLVIYIISRPRQTSNREIGKGLLAISQQQQAALDNSKLAILDETRHRDVAHIV